MRRILGKAISRVEGESCLTAHERFARPVWLLGTKVLTKLLTKERCVIEIIDRINGFKRLFIGFVRIMVDVGVIDIGIIRIVPELAGKTVPKGGSHQV